MGDPRDEADIAYKRIKAMINAYEFDPEMRGYLMKVLVIDTIMRIPDTKIRLMYIEDFFNSLLDAVKVAHETMDNIE